MRVHSLPLPSRDAAQPARLLGLGLLSLLAAAIVPIRMSAQAAPMKDTLLARLTAEAIAANPSLESSRAMARAAAVRVRPAGALPDPMLSAGVMNLTLPRFAFRESDFTEVDVELSQEFPWPGTLGARTAVARAQARSSQADVAARHRAIIVRTAELYYRLRYIVTARATLTRQRELLAAGVDISTARYASTSAPQSDPLQARVALARLDTEDADLEAEESELRARLKALRNVTTTDSLVVEPIRAELVARNLRLSSASGDPIGGDPSVQDSLPSHPRLLARQAAIAAAEQMVRVEQLGGRPDFTIMTRYGARPIASDFFSAFIGLRIPLYAGRKQHRLADAARAEADAARAALAEEQALLAEEIRTTQAQLRSEAARFRLLTDQVVPASQATVDATLRSYRVGQVEFLTVLAAEDALYRARLDAARVAADHLTHLVMLEQLVTPEEDS
jgi:cobalt-zinc-cadmium efflux system outer membrane protein